MNLVQETKYSDFLKRFLSLILFMVFLVGFIFSIFMVPIALKEISRGDYLSFKVLRGFGVLTITIVSLKIGAKLNRGRKTPKTRGDGTLSIDRPWLISQEIAKQYEEVVFWPKKGIEFLNDKDKHSHLFSFDEVSSISHSHNLREPVLRMITKDGHLYTIAFVIKAEDVKSLNKNLVSVALLGDVGSLLTSKSAIISSYRQLMIDGDNVEKVYRWFKKYNSKVYKNIISRNMLMLLIFVFGVPLSIAIFEFLFAIKLLN